MKQSNELGELATALVSAQKKMPSIEKDATGHGYKYASLDHIMAKVRPVLAQHGLTVTQQPIGGDNGLIGLTTRLLHESGQWMEGTVYAPRVESKRINDVQGAGSTITYLRRYGIAALLGLADETDTDAASGTKSTSNGQSSTSSTTTRPEPSEPPQRPDNGAQKPRKHTRPLEAPRLRDFLRRKAADYASNGRIANDKQRGLCMGMLNECFATDDADDRRRSVLAYVFEVDSGTELTDGQVLALLDWLNVEKDSGGAYTPDGTAVTEAGFVVRARMEEIGQDALFPEEAA